jgi:oligoendopeptidase F
MAPVRTALIRVTGVALLFGLVAATVTPRAQDRDRSAVPEQYTWNLADIYPSVAAWRAARDSFARELTDLAPYKGRLASSASTLADALEKQTSLEKTLARLRTYASLLADQDTRQAEPQGMKQEMTELASRFNGESAYIEPEILKADAGTLRQFMSSEPRLGPYRFYLDDVIRRGAHTLSDDEERLLAAAGPLSGASSNTFNILENADLPYPTVTLSDGRQVKIDQAGFADLRALPDRGDRERVMTAFFRTFEAFNRTFGTTMNGEVQKVLFNTRVRRYPSALEYALDRPNIPTSVYRRLIDGVNANLSVFHRYLKLRRRMLGLDQLHYYDLYAPLVGSENTRYSPEDARRLVVAAVAPLGPDYQAAIGRAFDERWIDLMPTTGKASGGYSTAGAYGVHPYMLINFNGQYVDVSTVAHELGHTMQSYLSQKAQPFPLAYYPIFVAEVASTFNESLLIDYMLQHTSDDDVKLTLLGNYLENLKANVFRQTQFAEFELGMYQMAEKGQPLTGSALSKLYLDITKKYYGHDQGVCLVDDYIAHEWSYVPHFYRDFYVFQYATSFTASEALAARVKAGDADATRRYLAFLSAGGSKYPIDLLKDAGVDMTTDEPLRLTMARMNAVMDEMEQLIARKEQRGRK